MCETPQEPPIVLAAYDGRVDRIDRKFAYLTLWDSHQSYCAEISRERLVEHGIGEGDRLKCEITLGGTLLRITLHKVPLRELSEADRQRIQARLDEMLPDEILVDNKPEDGST